MNMKFKVTEKKLFLWFIILLLPLFIVKSLEFPVNVDELLHYEHAKKVVEWYRTAGDNKACLDTPWNNLKYYGQSVDNFTALINHWIDPVNEYTVRHITGAFFGWLLILFASLIAVEISGRYRTALYTALLLLLLPPVMGQYCNNLKDIPFSAGYAFALYAMIKCFKSLPRIPWKYIFQLSLAIAFIISVRIGGLIIFPYFFLFLILIIAGSGTQNLFQVYHRKQLYRLLFQFFSVMVACRNIFSTYIGALLQPGNV
jgi:dolichyl-phosphate-mannose--protein O-mannosyl transferase